MVSKHRLNSLVTSLLSLLCGPSQTQGHPNQAATPPKETSLDLSQCQKPGMNLESTPGSTAMTLSRLKDMTTTMVQVSPSDGSPQQLKHGDYSHLSASAETNPVRQTQQRTTQDAETQTHITQKPF